MKKTLLFALFSIPVFAGFANQRPTRKGDKNFTTPIDEIATLPDSSGGDLKANIPGMYILKPEVNNSIEKNNIVELTGEPCDSTFANCAWDLRGFIYNAEDIVKTQKVYYGKKDLSTPIIDYYDKA